jgi:hypothetical protein
MEIYELVFLGTDKRLISSKSFDSEESEDGMRVSDAYTERVYKTVYSYQIISLKAPGMDAFKERESFINTWKISDREKRSKIATMYVDTVEIGREYFTSDSKVNDSCVVCVSDEGDYSTCRFISFKEQHGEIIPVLTPTELTASEEDAVFDFMDAYFQRPNKD